MNLYQLGREEMRLCELLEIEDMTPEQDAELCDLFAAHAVAESAKADGYIRVMRSFELQAMAIGLEVARLNKRAKAAVLAQDRMKERLKWYLETTGKTGIDGNLGAFKLARNPARVEVDDVDALPTDMVRVIPERREADKVAIKAAIKSGREIPGAVLLPGEMVVRMKTDRSTDDGE